MDDCVAVESRLRDGSRRYFMTWGRIQDSVDPKPLEELALRVAGAFDLGGEPVGAHVCATLREAADQPYFFEGLLHFARMAIPFGPDYESWRVEMAEAMAQGKEIFNLGRPI